MSFLFISDPDPDPDRQKVSDPAGSGSGSTTLVKKMRNITEKECVRDNINIRRPRKNLNFITEGGMMSKQKIKTMRKQKGPNRLNMSFSIQVFLLAMSLYFR